jgi:methylenetetrahydrofolate dehydrogenase (NADP+)/methenyltetrahydrofolate cyclohydrolase
VNLKQKAAARVGIEFRKILLPENVSHEALLEEIGRLNADGSVHGILVQLPLPEGLETQTVIDAIHPRKDVDGFHPENIRLFLEGKETLTPVFPRAILELARSSRVSLAGQSAVVIANSALFGEMMAKALVREGVSGRYVLRSQLKENVGSVCEADIVISACGVPRLITGDMLKPGAIVIDGGIEKVGDEVVGDVDRESVEGLEGFLSPVPGGVGPVTVAGLLENTFRAAQTQAQNKTTR